MEARSLLRQAKRELGLYIRGSSRRPTDTTFVALRKLAIVELVLASGMKIGESILVTESAFRHDEGTLLLRGKGARERLIVVPDARSRGAPTK